MPITRIKSEVKAATVDAKVSGPPRKGDKAHEKFDYAGAGCGDGRPSMRTAIAASSTVGGELGGGFL